MQIVQKQGLCYRLVKQQFSVQKRIQENWLETLMHQIVCIFFLAILQFQITLGCQENNKNYQMRTSIIFIIQLKNNNIDYRFLNVG
ncbi:unnamed protein product [Paramecium octaurelia]|uniref:Transmembrane protein n=1 Tax=Paramecium octaurelia TaxID=43137 RepID=A0A8S1XYP4_PAROT|nr:unnamed protein product [Paramecium octaurelia]